MAVNEMINKIVHIIIACFAVTASGAPLYGDVEKNVSSSMNSIETVVEAHGNSGRLLFIIRNKGSWPIKVIKDYLPWNTRNSLKLLIVPLPPGMAAVEPVALIEDPRATVQEIGAGAEIRGEVDVSLLFPRWKELIEHEMILVWSLSLTDTTSAEKRRFSGVIEYFR